MKKKYIILIIIWYYIWIAVCDIETSMKWFMISLKNASDELLMAQSPHVIVDGKDAKDKALEWVIICFTKITVLPCSEVHHNLAKFHICESIYCLLNILIYLKLYVIQVLSSWCREVDVKSHSRGYLRLFLITIVVNFLSCWIIIIWY